MPHEMKTYEADITISVVIQATSQEAAEARAERCLPWIMFEPPQSAWWAVQPEYPRVDLECVVDLATEKNDAPVVMLFKKEAPHAE